MKASSRLIAACAGRCETPPIFGTGLFGFGSSPATIHGAFDPRPLPFCASSHAGSGMAAYLPPSWTAALGAHSVAMHLTRLHYFVVTAEEENVARAARRLRVAQPALSRQLAALER